MGHTLCRVGRKRIWGEDTRARLRTGTLARIKRALRKGEHQTTFIATAIERELERREATRKSTKRPHKR
jgi:hypothetical protein